MKTIYESKKRDDGSFTARLRLTISMLLLLVLGSGSMWGQTSITSLSQISDADGHYIISQDISGGTPGVSTFNGTLEAAINSETHMPYRITDLSAPLFTTLTGTVKNIVLEDVSISGNTGNTGAIACTANGAARIYNVGILSGSVGGTTNTGGLVGFLDGTARVVNCYSYANITSGTNKGGIVGNNNVASKQSNVATMVMNCMFYGTITSGGTISPIYGGQNIDNKNSGGLATYNYYLYRTDLAITDNKYNCALAVEEKFLNRFEIFRQLENSNKKLASIYATGSAADADSKMLKWVLETADRTISDPKPYPVLKAQGRYPSIINYDAGNAPDSMTVGRNHGGKLGKTLSVTISGVGINAPTGASITTGSLSLQRTDKDFDRFNFNYDKVQLPYYNDVGTGNYTGNRVVTGWKITSITGGTAGTYSAADAFGGYNFADRNCTQKDLYSVSERVFSQGAYFEVPYGVTGITIEPYWGVAAYVSDQYYDVVYKENGDNNYSGESVNVASAGLGTQATNNTNITINGSTQKVYTSIDNARKAMSIPTSGKTPYDYAVVLVGNVHQAGTLSNATTPYTITSVDLDNDNEPDYSFIFSHHRRQAVSPIRFDFLNVVGTAQAQKPNGTSRMLNVSIFNPKGWFEVTNTCNIYFVQFEGDNGSKTSAPIILLGGVFDQFTSTQNQKVTTSTQYIHLGSNCWFKAFGNGTHSDGFSFTQHVPVSVTGGDYDGFYLSGVYRPDAGIEQDNAECYISSGRFNEVAGAAQQMIDGDVHWQIYNADITNFYGGGINASKPITGDITVDIFNSHVDTYCGGPKFGDMQKSGTTFTTKYSTNQTGSSTKTYSTAITKDGKVTTNATGCEFNKFFGAGYGGTSYSELKFHDNTTYDFEDLQKKYTDDRGKYFNGQNTSYKSNYGNKGPGVATDFSYEFFVWSTGQVGARFYVKYASFSLAQCNDVESNLEKCTIKNNFYGGGSIGKVDGTATSVLNNCTVEGNVYAGGYSASLPTIPVRNSGFVTIPKFNNQSGMFESGEFSETTDFNWTSGTLTENATALNTKDGKHDIYTNTGLTGLGEVAKTVLTINGTTTVGESVYGGGEESGVGGDTEVTVNSGFIGAEGGNSYGYRYGNVYGGGKGKIDNDGKLMVSSVADLDAGLVKGNTSIIINGTKETTKIAHNVYGGGAVGSVGTFTRDGSGMPTACTEDTGNTTVTINGGQVGHNRKDTGMVDGSSRGWEGNPEGEGAFAFLNQLAWVNNTNVTIGDATSSAEDEGPSILGSVYGGGENGHNLENAVVTVNKGTIGNSDPSAAEYECGNIYGAGCGTDTFWRDDNNNGQVDEGEDNHHNPMAGIVRGTTSITVNGGHVLRNIYGGGSMGSVGGSTTVTNAGKTTIDINGGIIGVADTDYGYVFGGPKGNIKDTETIAEVQETQVNINPHPTDTSKPGADVKGSVFGGGEAGIVKGKVVVNMNGGQVANDVYGGGALANTNTIVLSGSSAGTVTTKVNLLGGKVNRNVYGGALGQTKRDADPTTGAEALDDIEAKVFGNVLVELNNGVADDAKGCVVLGSIFGCNNLNGTPMGDVTVHVFKTQNDAATRITNAPASGGTSAVDDAKVAGRYDVAAVYGGGNQSAYEPADLTNNKTEVIIDGCGSTSIRQVYGGGNAACTPATNVTVNGTFEIMELFGGGNGLDNIFINDVEMPNPGANVGYKNYSEYYKDGNTWKVRDKSDADTKGERIESSYIYGTGKASVNIYGGRIHRVFGGSNTKGNVRQTAVTLLEEQEGEDCCPFQVDEAYGGGKSAEMDAEAQLLMACIPGLQAVYGGAEAADVRGNVTLNITNGTFDRVFGGNNLSGTIGGSITVNVEEIGCRPVKIGELYGGGNQAGYSVYGYDSDGKPKETGTKLYDDPQVNAMSFTSIGNIYGGGYGDGATMVGNPTVNVNEYYGKYYNDDVSVVGENAKTPNDYPIPSHEKGKIGAINTVFGGGNAAKVIGNTAVNIGTLSEVYIVKQVTAGSAVSEYYILNPDGTYSKATGTAADGTTYYEKKDVVGVDIRGNVYGGGNNAEVTGSTNVHIGKEEPSSGNQSQGD